MIVALKIMLAIISIACFYLDYFAIQQYRIWKGSQEANESSVFEKMLVNTMAFSSVVILTAISILSIVIIFSDVTVTVPW